MADDRFDLAVVGAGPAGLAAAVTAAEHGLRVALVDAGGQPGGQYWRHPDETATRYDESAGHHHWERFQDLRSRLRGLTVALEARVTYVPNRQVWFIEHDPGRTSYTLSLTATHHQAAEQPAPRQVVAGALALCPGGYDRQLPVDGWDLPGVLTAGGVQALLKAHRTVAGRRAVVAGTGPFLLPVAQGLAGAGATVVAVCEANAVAGWARSPLGALAVPSKGLEAAQYAVALARHRIPYRTRTAVTAIHGNDQVRAVSLSKLDRGGRIRGDVPPRDVEVDLVAFGWGFTPSLELVAAVGAATRVDADESLVAEVDGWQRSDVRGVYVAGEATGVGGALLAQAEGELAGLAACVDRGVRVPDRRVRRLQRSVARSRAFALAMHRAHPVPAAWREWLRPQTTVCRCEEVTFADVCAAREELGATDARTVKLLTRAGMGWCQGRVCGFATAKLAARRGQPMTAAELAPTVKRPLAAPVALGDLANVTELEMG